MCGECKGWNNRDNMGAAIAGWRTRSHGSIYEGSRRKEAKCGFEVQAPRFALVLTSL